MSKLEPTHIVIHHSGTNDSESLSWGIIKYNHQRLGYDDIGYHYGIEYVRTDHEILCGRMPYTKGAHCRDKGMNHKAIGICFIGNFNIMAPTSGQWNKGLELVRYLEGLLVPCTKDQWINGHYVIGHKEIKDTDCPGKFFDMDKFRSEI